MTVDLCMAYVLDACFSDLDLENVWKAHPTCYLFLFSGGVFCFLFFLLFLTENTPLLKIVPSICCCSVPQLNTEGHPVCAPTPVHIQVYVQSIGWEVCMCDHFQWPRHVGSRTPSLKDFNSLSREWGCYVMSLSWLKIIPTQQDITMFYCSLSVLACINKWW